MTAWPARRRAVVFRLDTRPEPLRLFVGGFGDLRLPGDPIEPDPSALYRGCGELTSLAPVNQLINGVAERVDFTLAGDGLTAEVCGIAADEAESVRWARVNLGVARFAPGKAKIQGPVKWLWEGLADVVTLTAQMTGTDPGEPPVLTRTMGLSVGSTFALRSRPRVAYWTRVHQRARSADDAFCDRVAGYSSETGMLWKTS